MTSIRYNVSNPSDNLAAQSRSVPLCIRVEFVSVALKTFSGIDTVVVARDLDNAAETEAAWIYGFTPRIGRHA